MLFLKKMLAGMCLLLGTLTVFGDEFEDMIATCSVLSRNYKNAVEASKSDYAKEYQQYLTSFELQAGKVQAVIRKLKLGKDFNFTEIAQELRRVYNTAVQSYKSGQNVSKNDLAKYSVDPARLFKMLLFDIKELRKMEFSMEDGGSVKITFETRRRLYEFERLFRLFKSGGHANQTKAVKEDPSYQVIFEKRIERMRGLAQELTNLHEQKYPNGGSRYNLAAETNKMLTEYRKLSEYKAPKRKQYSNYNELKKKSSSRKKTQPDERITIRRDMNLYIRNVNDTIQEWLRSNFLTDPPISAPGGNGKAAADPAAVMLDPKITKHDYSRMSAENLSVELKKRRRQILRYNSSIDGLDSKTERRYLQTLSRMQRKEYQIIFKAAKDQGYETEVAAKNTVMQMQMKINGKEFTTSEKEMIQILEKIDKDEKKEISRSKVNF